MKRGARTVRPDVFASQFEFVPLAVQHYVAGRMLALQCQMPVAGNILHHAVELLLKAALASKVPFDALKDQYRHDLVLIWAKFQEEYRAMPEHGATIEDLNRFEEIRYPGPAGGTTQSHYALYRDPQGRRMGSPGAYSLVLEDIDALFRDVIAERNVAFLFSNELKLLPPFSRTCLLEKNRHTLSLEPPNKSFERTREG
jgi:hypothetical protein